MTYNLHPIFVHFPIALLFLYSVIKILPLEKWFPRFSWRDLGLFLLSFGVLGAFAALVTGNIAEELVKPAEKLVDAHSNFAMASTILYAILLIGEWAKFFGSFPVLEKTISNPIFSKFLALVAIICIAITGLLGGVMVYGMSADPLAGIVLRLLGITLN